MSIGDRPNTSTPPPDRRDISSLQGITPKLQRAMESLFRDVNSTLPDATQDVGQAVQQLVLDTDALKQAHYLVYQTDVVIPNGRLPIASDILTALAGQGSPNTVLHGGATPAFASVSLSSDVSGILPLASGGTGANTAPGARTSLGLGTMATQNASDYALLAGASFTGQVSAPRFFSSTASVSAPSGVATTVFTIPTAAPALYIVMVNIGLVGDAVNFGAIGIIYADSASTRFVLQNNSSTQTISLSGLNVQSTQATGATQTINGTITRIG